MRFTEKTIDQEILYKGKILSLELLTVELNNGNKAKREVVRHSGGVGVAAITTNHEIFLVRQFRKPYDKELLEIPAGKLEAGEAPEQCAARELKEETGLTAARFTNLTTMYPSPGYTDEKIYIYKAEGLSEGETCFDENEFLNVERYSISDSLGMIKSGEINDAKTIIAIQQLALEIK